MNRRRKRSMNCFTIPLLLYSLFSILILSSAVDTISKTQFFTDGQTIVSSDESFEMGFFSPGGSNNRYVGIWYKKISPGLVVWVANREIPLNDTLGVLMVIDPGILVLLNGTNNTIWSTNTSRTVQNPIVQLLDSGNLVVKDANDNSTDNFLWQGFDYPCDTLLPGMKLGKSLVTGQEWYISSWKSTDDPAKGDYAYWLDLRGYPQIFISNGSVEMFRTGPWNGLRFSGTPSLRTNPIYNFGMYFERQEVFYRFDLYNSSIVSRFIMNSNGIAQRWTWVDRTKGWVLYLNAPTDNCDAYKLCGPYGSCDVNQSPVCSCLDKFVPRYRKDWEMTDWSGGCVRRIQLDCHNGDGFVKYSNIKLPDTRSSWYNVTMTLWECEEVCLKNCSCMAYTNLDIRGSGSGCLLWFDELVDIREFSENGQDIYVRIAFSDLDSPIQQGGSNDKKKVIIIVVLTIIIVMFLLGLCVLLYFWKRKKKDELLRTEESHVQSSRHGHSNQSQKEDLELPLFDFDTIASSTNNFSAENKLGQGGFGPVHQGRLEDGREIAVKRLSKTSRQGLDEFKNEVICIAKLQHRNLVKLLGCCIQGEERMLIYEFMPNKSLDSFIFDERRRTLLDWPKRYNIIIGIARGLLYLHQDSRLRIIHRDLKASNILLDIETNPKISDFGMARIFGGNETERNTARVVGTYGYMSPEYLVDGLFSAKSDVFSFGVLVLEIVSGRRNRGFFHADHYLNLLGHLKIIRLEIKNIDGDVAPFSMPKLAQQPALAKIWREVYLSGASVLAWTLHKEDRSIELIDPTARKSCCPSEVLRSIHVGLLCVQQHPEDRPSMSSVVLMLGSEGSLPWPKQPGFFTDRNLYEADTSSSKNAPSSTSTNDLTITVLEPR